jgi:hypothetical protein
MERYLKCLCVQEDKMFTLVSMRALLGDYEKHNAFLMPTALSNHSNLLSKDISLDYFFVTFYCFFMLCLCNME